MREKQGMDFGKSIKAVVATTAGAGLGVLGAVAGVTAAAVVLEVALPVTLCVWAGGIACGALGLSIGVGKGREEGDRDSRVPDSRARILNRSQAEPGSEPSRSLRAGSGQQAVFLPGDTKEEKRC